MSSGARGMREMRGMRTGVRRGWLHAAGAVALMGAVSLAGCGGTDDGEAVAQVPGGRPGGGGAGGAPRGGGGPTPVETARVVRGEIARSVTVSGVVEPIRSVGVNSQLSGTLLSVDAEEGTRVRVGQSLAQIDVRELEAQLASAEAAYQVAEAAYERARQLRDRRVITLPEYERDRTAWAAARAQLDQLRTRLGYAAVASPIAGVVTEKRVEAGDLVSPQTPLFTVADVSTLVVRVGVSELDVAQLEPGDDARATLDAFPGRIVEARIRRIFPTADPTTRLVPVEVALSPGAGGFVRPGYLARVEFAVGRHDDVLLLPQAALVGAGGSEAVFVVQDGSSVRRTVQTGLVHEGLVEILAGVEEGDEVVTAGNTLLRDGAAVRVMTGAVPALPAPAGDGR